MRDSASRDLQFTVAVIGAEANLARLDSDIRAHERFNAERRRTAMERQSAAAQREIDRAFARRRP